MEKFYTHVEIRRSKNLENVRDRNGSELRVREAKVKSIIQVKSDACPQSKTPKDLIEIIQKEKLVSQKYNLLTENCKHFASCVYKGLTGEDCTVGHGGDLPHPCPRTEPESSLCS